MKRVPVRLKTATTVAVDTAELIAAQNGQAGKAMILNGATGNVFVSENSGERAKTVATLVSELGAYETAAMPAASPYKIGAWYYPGWMGNDSLSYFQPDPWAFIRPYPERMPLMGSYDDDAQDAANNHIRVAKSYGIDWFGVCWFCLGVSGSDSVSIPAKPAGGMAAMLASPEAGAGFKISLLWDSQTTNSIDKDNGVNATSARFLARFDAACVAMASLIQANPTKWLQRGGKYMLTLRGEHWTTALVPRSGLTGSQLMTRLRTTMAAASAVVNAAGVHVGYWGTASGDRVRVQAQGNGFDSWTSYGYYSSILNKDSNASVGPSPQSYEEHSAVFATENTWLTSSPNNAANTVKYTLPLCGGWDARPWSGSVIGRPTPEQFRAHLIQQKAILDADLTSGSPKAEGWAVICTWNEHGEGSAICPTVSDSYALVQAIRDVLKP